LKTDMSKAYKIHAPAVRYEDIEILAKEGADTFYMGYLEKSAKNETTPSVTNRRPYRHANVDSFDEIEAMIKKAHELDKRTAFCANETYDETGFDNISADIERIISMGIDHIIVSDVGLISLIKNKYPETRVVLSTVSTAMNYLDVEFFSNLGVSAVTLIRQLLIDEVKSIVHKCPEMEFIVFIYGSKCPNIDGYCSFHHGFIEKENPLLSIYNIPILRNVLERVRVPEAASVYMKKRFIQSDLGCSLQYESIPITNDPATPVPNWHFNNTLECGLCALWDFYNAGIRGFKIVGREHPLYKRVERVRMTRLAIEQLVQFPDIDRVSFHNYCREMTKCTLKHDCNRCDCYYPETYV
jgi:U32 family peptidase